MRRGTTARPARDPRAERGMSMTAVMAVMGVAVFLGLFAFKAAPAYFENLTVKSVVADAVADEELMRSPKSKVYRQIDAQYGMNNLWGMKAKDTVELKRAKNGGYDVRVNYERREPLFANIDLVMHFDQPMTGQE